MELGRCNEPMPVVAQSKLRLNGQRYQKQSDEREWEEIKKIVRVKSLQIFISTYG